MLSYKLLKNVLKLLVTSLQLLPTIAYVLPQMVDTDLYGTSSAIFDVLCCNKPPIYIQNTSALQFFDTQHTRIHSSSSSFTFFALETEKSGWFKQLYQLPDQRSHWLFITLFTNLRLFYELTHTHWPSWTHSRNTSLGYVSNALKWSYNGNKWKWWRIMRREQLC